MQILKRKSSIKKIRKLQNRRDIDLWALDEVHFQQHGSSCRMWIPPETTDPVLLHHPTRKSVGYFGAVRLRDGKMVKTREENSFDGETFLNFMKRLHQIAANSGRQAVVIIDNARYHHARMHKEWRKQHKKDIMLMYLPPYSPDLNPIERVWKLTRRLATHNQYFAHLDDLVITVENVFEKWRSGSETLRKLCAIT